MAGYRADYSMSNNAYYAYQDGEMPLSKWSKECILEEIKAIASEECIDVDFDKLKKLSKKLGTIYYFEWSGPRKYPKAVECCEENIYIETKGCFYLCYKKATDEKPFFKKKIDSNGTKVVF